jgi:hypothetical protein
MGVTVEYRNGTELGKIWAFINVFLFRMQNNLYLIFALMVITNELLDRNILNRYGDRPRLKCKVLYIN